MRCARCGERILPAEPFDVGQRGARPGAGTRRNGERFFPCASPTDRLAPLVSIVSPLPKRGIGQVRASTRSPPLRLRGQRRMRWSADRAAVLSPPR